MSNDTLSPHPRSSTWKWAVCGVLLLATMLNYMDRQTLAQAKTEIKTELKFNDQLYGRLEMGFGLAFAVGGILWGLLVDRLGVRYIYPLVVLGWSLAGVATAYSEPIGLHLGPLLRPIFRSNNDTYSGLLFCRIVLGIFEAGQWPCALITTQRILSRQELSFGNSILQSGASIGAIFTPQIVKLTVTDEPGTWRLPFQVIGLVGMIWVIPWFMMIRRRDLDLRVDVANPVEPQPLSSPTTITAPVPNERNVFIVRFVALVVMVIALNLTWQFFRAWLPGFLREFHSYDKADVQNFSTAYYIATDVGCILAGFAVRQLSAKGMDIHRARMATFFVCAALTALSLIVAVLPKGPLLLGLLLLIGAGALGLFPNYYAFTQELSKRHQGKVTGALSAITWTITAIMQELVGKNIDETKSYSTAITVVGIVPLIGFLAVALLWNAATPRKAG